MITDDLGLVFLVIHIGRKTARYVVSQQTNVITNCSKFTKSAFILKIWRCVTLPVGLHLDRRGGNLLSQTDGRLRSGSAKFDMENQTSPCAAPLKLRAHFFFILFFLKSAHAPVFFALPHVLQRNTF